MHIANWILDTVIVAVALGLAGMLRRRFFYVALILTIGLGIMRLHYGLQYSWTFVGKIAVDFAVPLAMGWAGVHLAAEVKEDRERKLWQAVFALLALFGLVVGFLVERQLDTDHKAEMGDLRAGIKNDMTTALINYNNANPRHQVTSEQFAAFTNSLIGKHSAEESIPVPVSAQNKFANITNERLADMAKSTVEEIRSLAGQWRFQDHDAYMKATDWTYSSGRLGRPATAQERADAEAQAERDKIEVAKSFRDQSKAILTNADELRSAILSRLPSNTLSHDRGDSLFVHLTKDNYNVADLESAASYLESLRKALI